MKKINLKRVLTIISVFGPAVLVSVELFDPASIVAATAAGAAVGFAVLWAAFYSGVLLIGIQEISARLRRRHWKNFSGKHTSKVWTTLFLSTLHNFDVSEPRHANC